MDDDRKSVTTSVSGNNLDCTMFLRSNDYRIGDLVTGNDLLRDAWLHAPRRDEGREWDVSNHWPILLDILNERDDEWAHGLRDKIVYVAERIWPGHAALHKHPKKGEPVSGSMSFG